jgi:hypothetical protein
VYVSRDLLIARLAQVSRPGQSRRVKSAPGRITGFFQTLPVYYLGAPVTVAAS